MSNLTLIVLMLASNLPSARTPQIQSIGDLLQELTALPDSGSEKQAYIALGKGSVAGYIVLAKTPEKKLAKVISATTPFNASFAQKVVLSKLGKSTIKFAKRAAVFTTALSLAELAALQLEINKSDDTSTARINVDGDMVASELPIVDNIERPNLIEKDDAVTKSKMEDGNRSVSSTQNGLLRSIFEHWWRHVLAATGALSVLYFYLKFEFRIFD